MLIYTYNTSHFRPPAPFVHVTLRNGDSSREIADVPAQLDTACDRTVIPWQFVEDLQLVELDQLTVAGFAGMTHTVPTFLAQVEIRQLRPVLVEVFGVKEERWVILGRDVLNEFKIVLDGPRLRLEIE